MKQCPVTPILAELAAEMGIDLVIEPRYGYVGCLRLSDGRRRYFRSTVFDLNGAGATEIAKDKDYAASFLARCGYPVPEGESFHTRKWCKAIGSDRTPERAWEYAETLGLPVIVKPNSKSQGAGVALVHDEKEFFKAVRVASQGERVFLVQRPAPGIDYRIVVLDGTILSAYERRPLAVTGDGVSSIQRLLEEKQREFETSGRDTQLRLDDERITRNLVRQGYARTSILPKDASLKLLPNANLSTGGTAVDVTDTTHPEWTELAARIARDMNLRYTGIDIMTPHALSEEPKDYVVLEINAAPGLDHYATVGKKQEEVVRELYRKVLRALSE